MSRIRIVRVIPPAVEPCRYCIDGFQPDGRHPILGPVYIRCAVCITNAALPLCSGCQGDAWFPAGYTCPHCLIKFLVGLGYLPVFCPGCTGVTAFLPVHPGGQP